MKNNRALIFLPAFLALSLLAPSMGRGQESGPLHLREIYVPHEEFLERARQDPDGVIMELDEYRSLVLKGVVASRKAPPEDLPPVSAIVTQGRHIGELSGKTARFTSKIEVRVTRDGWVRCPLDPLPEALGSIRVNGKPGWLLRQASKPPQKKSPGSVVFLLLKGRGTHQVELTYSVPAVETEDFWSIKGALPRAESGTLQLEVPGYADASSSPPNLLVETVPATKGSLLKLSLGSSSGFSITWKMKRVAGKSGSTLSALNGMTILPRLNDPLFAWNSRVWIQRRKTDVLQFNEPAGARTITVTGDIVHSWSRQDDSILVLLKEPTTGLVDVLFEGILQGETIENDQAPARRYLVGPPKLANAYSNSGYLAVCQIQPELLQLEAREATEIALKDGLFPSIQNHRVTRCFSYTSESSRLEFTARARASEFESRSASLVQVLESGVTLDAIYHLDMTRGSEYRFVATLPAPWNLTGLQALTPKGGPGRNPSWEVFEADGERAVEIKLENAFHTGQPLVLSLRLEHMSFPPDIAWPERELEFSLPHFSGAVKSRTDFGVKLPDSMFAVIPELPGWETLKSDELRRAGFASAVDEESGLAAGLTSTTENASQPVSLTLKHRRPMGEYQGLTHLLALEDRFRARNDLRLAIVDRAIDEVRVQLPIGKDVQAPVSGEGIKEVLVEEDGASGSVRIIRYAKPWTGTREIRIEYEALEDDLPKAGENYRVPWLKLSSDPDDPLAPVFDGNHQLVFQSLGAVKIEVVEGAELASLEVDALPELGQPWAEGRILFAFQFKSKAGPRLPPGEQAASFKILKFDRADVLGIISREMDLTTVIDPSGVSRTHLNAVIAYNRKHQHIEIQLPEGARILSARVGNDPAPYVRRNEETGYWQIPLPPLSYSSISLTYKRSSPLGQWGAWSERAPVFRGVPVISTTWKTYHPMGFRFQISGGNLLEKDPSPLPASFLDLLYSAISTGQIPPHGLLAHESEARPYFSGEGFSELPGPADLRTNPGLQAGDFGQAAQDIAPEQNDINGRVRATDKAAIFPLHLEGNLVEARKLGGDAVLSFSYRNLGWWKFSKRTAFLLTLVLGLFIVVRHGTAAFRIFVVGGLFAGAILSDMAARTIGWESPFLLIPACEALSALLAAGLIMKSIRALSLRLVARRRARAAAVATLALCLASAGALTAQDEILIPYEARNLDGFTTEAKVYLPYEKFRALWLLANPEKEGSAEKPAADIVLGGGTYVIDIDDDTYRIKGGAPALILTEKWVTLPLPFPRGKLKTVLVDGKPVGVAQKDGVPFITLKGKGTRLIEIESTGPVSNRLGSYSINARLLSGPAATLAGSLPAGALPAVPENTAGLTFQKETEGTALQLDIGPAAGFSLSWTFPRISGKQKARLESTSYTDLQLTLDGYNIHRSEQISAAGIPAGSLTYEILGDWNITSVSSPELSEWTISEENENRYLSIFFSAPVKEAALEFKGWAPLQAGQDKQVSSLSLDGALRQASYIGVRHDSRRRWKPGILSNQRASIDELRDSLKRPPAPPDRLYQFFESLEGQSVSAIPLAGTADAVTDAVLYISRGRSILDTRTRYQVGIEGPLRQEVALPSGWEFRNVRGATVSDWEVVDTEDGPRLIILLSSRPENGTQISWSAQRIHTEPLDRLKVPLLRTTTLAPGLRSETVLVSIAAAEELDVRVADGSSGIEKVARTNADLPARLPSASRRLFDMRSTGTVPSYSLELELGNREGQPAAKTVLFARVAEDFILINGQVEISITGGLQDTFFFRLPAGVAETSLRTRNLKSLTRDADGPLKLTLTSGIVGKHTVALSYRIPRNPADAGVLIRPFQVLREDNSVADSDLWVGLVETGEVLTNPQPSGLEKVRIEDLPYLPDGVASDSLQHVYRAARSDWELTLTPESLRPAETAQASVDLVDLVTVIGADGTFRTKAVYTISNRKLQFLRIELPGQTQLWGATLNGNPMIVSKNQEALQVPLKHVGLGDLNLEVGIVYAHTRKADLPTLKGDLDLQAPRVLGQAPAGSTLKEVTVRRTLWRIELPDGFEASLDDGNMQEVVSSIQYASKVESNIQDIERLTRILTLEGGPGESDSARGKLNLRQRRQASLSLKRLQQALSDNVMDLEESKSSAAADGIRQQLGGAAITSQQAESEQALNRGRQAQKLLEKAIRDTSQQKVPARGQQEQAFRDNYNFKGNDWIRNVSPLQQRDSKSPGTPSAPHIYDRLHKTLFAGFRFTSAPMKESEVEKAQGMAVAASGLAPLPPTRINQVNPALESPPAPPGATSLTFRRSGGEARLTLSLSRKGHLLRFISPAVLFLAIALFAWRLGRKPQRS